MEYLENDFAQIEHINQVIANNLDHESWDCFDTYELLRQFPHLGTFQEGKPEQSFLVIPDNVKNIYDEPVNGFSFIRYNSFIISIKKGTVKENGKNVEYYEYTFEVRNTLWDGTYKISKTFKDKNGEYVKFAEEEFTVTQSDDELDKSAENLNTIVVTVFGNDKNKLRVCFHMNMAGSGRIIDFTSLPLVLDSKTDFVHQYDTVNYEKATVSLSNGREGKNINVELVPCDEAGRKITYDATKVGPYLPPQTFKGVKKEFNVTYGETSVPGDYYCKLSASSTEKTIKPAADKIIHVKKVQNEKAVLDWGDDSLYKNIYKGCRHKYRLKFNLQNEMGGQGKAEKLLDIPVTVTFVQASGKKTVYDSAIKKDESNNEYYIEVTVSYRNYYEDHSRLSVELSSDYGFGRIQTEKLIKHPWFIADTYDDIVSQLYLTNNEGKYVNEKGVVVTDPVENYYGTDFVFVKNKTYNVNKSLLINRDFTLASVIGKENNYATFEGNYYTIIKTVNPSPSSSNLTKVNLVGLRFMHGGCAIHSSAGTRLLIDRCIFTQNQHEDKHHKGCSVYIPETDYSVKHPELWKTEIRNSHFENNRGNEIQSIGTTRIIYNKFVTTASKWLQQPEVKVVSVKGGSTYYANNISYINTGKKPMVSNHSYAKALAYVAWGATFNGAGPRSLQGYNALPLYKNYNNQAYTYSIYYYPYGNVRTNIVCSPEWGKERKATGHSSAIENWVYYDGYYFLRWEGGRNTGNTRDPWTKEELAPPKIPGIYSINGEKFVEDYDPRIAKAKCLTSYFD